MRSYNRISSHRSKILGSFWGKPAFMGKLVLGRLIVDFRSSGTRFEFSQILDLFHYREQSKGRLFPQAKPLLTGNNARFYRVVRKELSCPVGENLAAKESIMKCTIFLKLRFPSVSI